MAGALGAVPRTTSPSSSCVRTPERQHREQHDPPDDEVDGDEAADPSLTPAPARSACRGSPWDGGRSPACHARRSSARRRRGRARPAPAAVARGEDVVDLVAEVMDAAGRVAFEEAAIGELSPSGSISSILVLGSSTKTMVTPWSGMRHRLGNLGAERVAIERRGGREVGDGDRDMVQPADHGSPLIRPRRGHVQIGFLPQASATAAARRRAGPPRARPRRSRRARPRERVERADDRVQRGLRERPAVGVVRAACRSARRRDRPSDSPRCVEHDRHGDVAGESQPPPLGDADRLEAADETAVR